MKRLTLACLLSVWWCASVAWANNSDEYRLKAAFLYNFISFTEWPATSGGTLTVCVYGPDPFGQDLDSLQNKKVGGRSVAVKRTNTAEGLDTCQVVFITRPVISNLSRVLDNLNGKPVLIVADSPGAGRDGATLNMSVEQNNILFEANLSAAQNRGLILSSKLLHLAKEIYK